MDVTSTSLKALNAAVSKVFHAQLLAFAVATMQHTKIATVVNAKSGSVNYAWLGYLPKMREWAGKRTLELLTMGKYTIDKKKWESTVKIPLEFVRDDTIGLIKPIVQGFAQEAASHYDELVVPLLESNNAGYDGIKFFSDIHPIKGANKASNIGTAALSQDSMLAARTQMRKLTNPEGKPLGIRPSLLVVPPELEAQALKILKAKQVGGGDSNVSHNLMEILVLDHLTDDKAWYLMDNTRPIKPLILQKHTPITFTAMSKPDDEAVFMEDVARYGVMSEDNAGYGLWQLAYKSDGTA